MRRLHNLYRRIYRWLEDHLPDPDAGPKDPLAGREIFIQVDGREQLVTIDGEGNILHPVDARKEHRWGPTDDPFSVLHRKDMGSLLQSVDYYLYRKNYEAAGDKLIEARGLHNRSVCSTNHKPGVWCHTCAKSY